MFANTTTKVWEFQQLGPGALTEGLGEVFRYAWADPVWLRRYRSFVQAHNAEARRNDPVMNDQDIRELAHNRSNVFGITGRRSRSRSRCARDGTHRGWSPT